MRCQEDRIQVAKGAHEEVHMHDCGRVATSDHHPAPAPPVRMLRVRSLPMPLGLPVASAAMVEHYERSGDQVLRYTPLVEFEHSTEGSLAFHITHEWDRRSLPDGSWGGIWCVDCDEWVEKPRGDNGSEARP